MQEETALMKAWEKENPEIELQKNYDVWFHEGWIYCECRACRKVYRVCKDSFDGCMAALMLAAINSLNICPECENVKGS